MWKSTFTIVFIISTIAYNAVTAAQVPIIPRLELISGINGNATYVIYNKEDGNFRNDQIFLGMLGRTTRICTIGIWRFYPNLDFGIDDGNIGVQLGISEKYRCLDVTPEKIQELLEMRSYRFLGPADLNQFSVYVYSEPHASGMEIALENLKEFDFVDAFPVVLVKSYVITGITDPQITNQNTLAPVLKVFWEEGGGHDGNKICLAVINEEVQGEGNAKMFYGETMVPVPDEPQQIMEFGSFFFLRYSTASSIPGLCYETNDNNFLSMVELPRPPPPITAGLL